MATPRHHTPRSDRPTLGHGVAAIAQAKGRPLMPWQRQAVDVALEVDPTTGRYHYGIVVVTVPRQSGKTKLEGDVADHRCLTVPRGRAWYTAQTGKDASAWMRDEHFAGLRDARMFGTPGTPSAKYRVSRRAGQEGVEWPAIGSTFRVFAPLRDALHGKQSDLVFLDEAWSLSADEGADVRQAVRPTMATRPGAQLWVVSTMGDDLSTFFHEYVDAGIASLDDPSARVCLIDYGIGDDVDPEDLDAVAAVHPAYGHTMTRRVLEDARADFGDDVAGWARAYGNRRTRTRLAAIDPAAWERCGTGRPEVPERAGIAFDVTPDGRRYALAAAWRVDGKPVVELLHAGPVDAQAPALIRAAARARRSPLGYEPRSPGVLDLLDAIGKLDRSLQLEGMSRGEYANACLVLDRAIIDHTLRHSHQPDLTEATEVAAKAPAVDGGFTWFRRGSAGSICELVAVTAALRVFDTMPTPRGPLRVLTAQR